MRTSTAVTVVVIWLLCMAAQTPAAAQTPLFDGRGWTVGHQQRNEVQSLTEYVLPGQTVENWRELVTSTVHFQPVPVARLVDEIHRLMSKDCPSLIWNVIRQDERTIVFEWRDAGCGGYEPQAEIDRVTIEKDGLYRLAYAVKTKSPLAPDRASSGWRSSIKVLWRRATSLSARAGQTRRISAGRRTAAMAPAQKLSTEQLADAVQKSGWPCAAGLKSEIKGQTPSPLGMLDVGLLECSDGQRYSVLVGPSGLITAFPAKQ